MIMSLMGTTELGKMNNNCGSFNQQVKYDTVFHDKHIMYSS